jgi:hypothetical protein
MTAQQHYTLVAQRFNRIQKIKGVEYQKLSTSLKHAKLTTLNSALEYFKP